MVQFQRADKAQLVYSFVEEHNMGRQSVLFSIRVIALVGVIALGGFLLIATQFPQLLFAINGRIIEQHGSWRFDVTDPRRLVGASNNVFVGRVIKHVGSEGLPTTIPGDFIPRTQFAVDVVSNLKGTLAGTIIVNQDAGLRLNTLMVFEGDALLQPEEMYVFATSWDTDTNWHHIIAPGYANIPVKDENDLATLEARFRKAVQEEIPDMEQRNSEP